jgi:4-amino-4-deoxy-L-arabinose transferase-like glycosyltransferase
VGAGAVTHALRTRPRIGFGLALALIALAGLALRLYYSLRVMGDHRFTGDGVEFHYLARTLADRGAYEQPFPQLGLDALLNARSFDDVYARLADQHVPTAEKPPLYPGYLAIWAKLGLSSYRWNTVASSLAGTGTVALVGLVGRRVATARTGLVAAALAAVYLDLVILDGSVRSESLYVLLVAAALLAAYRLVERATWTRAAALGAAIGAAALTRSEGLFLLLLLALPAAWLAGTARRARLRLLGVAVAACAVLVVPWLARNWIVFDRPAAISTNEGGLLAGANCDRAYHGPFIGTWACFPRPRPEWGLNEAVISGHLRSRALDYVSGHAGRVPAVAGVRLLRTWELWNPGDAVEFEAQIADRNVRLSRWAQRMFWVAAMLAIAGAVVLRRRGARLRLLLALPLLVSLVSVLSYGSTRFRAAAAVTIVVLAAVALEAGGGRVLESIRHGRARDRMRLVRRDPAA